MPKKRKTRKHKIQAIMRPKTVETIATPLPSQEMQRIKIPEKFSLKPSSGQYNVNILNSHAYLKPELIKTALLSASIILCELILFFLLRNHLIVLLNLPY